MPNPTFSAFTSDIERNPEILERMKRAALKRGWGFRVHVRGKVTTVEARCRPDD